jgi:Peptidase family M28
MRARVLELCEFGNRFVGSPGERAVREYIRNELEDAGTGPARVEEFEVLGYEPGTASCEILGVAERPLPAVGLQFTASAEAVAEAVYLGSPGSVEDIQSLEDQGISLANRVLVVDTYWPYGLAEHAVAQGAAALVVVSPNSEGLLAHFSAQLYPPAGASPFDGRPLPIPGVTVERQAAQRLLALMAAGPRVLRVAHQAAYEPVSTANVIAEVPGAELPDERVVLGAHYDTQLDGVGACDNATGVAALIELARACAASPRRRTVVFVAFGDEEHGFHGSLAYCRRHAPTLDATVGMVCLDALAWVYPGSRALHADPSFQAYGVARAREAAWDPEQIVDASLLLGSDHNPFIDAGVPAGWFWRYPPQHPGYHSAGDGPELLDFELVAQTATVAGHTGFSLANERGNVLGRSRPTKRWCELRPSGRDAQTSERDPEAVR